MAQNISENNKRIAKNTLALYFRTFITMIVGLYTSRVMLQALGVDNYGINAVVGGIVSMTGLITGTMSAAISRYITYGLGEGQIEKLKNTFSTSLNAQLIIALIIILLLESIGVWFLNNEANIPEGRLYAANWVLQCSIVCTVLSLISTPFNAVIVAHEHMSIYAYLGIADVVFRLLICYLVMLYDGDRLILYSILLVCVSAISLLIYAIYSKKNFKEISYSPTKLDKSLLKDMTSFSGWNLLGTGAWIFNTQGSTMLVNVFFGVTFNAARGIANTVNAAIQSFVNNFTTAFTPQLTKSYAAGDIEGALKLTDRGTKLTWLLMLLFMVPVFVEAESILTLWLGKAPEYSATFLRFALFESLSIQIGIVLLKLVFADGRIKMYQIYCSLFVCGGFPISWIIMSLGGPVWTPYAVFITLYTAVEVVRFYTIKKTIPQFSVYNHTFYVLFPCALTTIIAFSLPILAEWHFEQSLTRFFILFPASFLWTGLCCFIFGLSRRERIFVIEKLKQVKQRIL